MLMGTAKECLKLLLTVGKVNAVYDAVHGRSFEIASKTNDLCHPLKGGNGFVETGATLFRRSPAAL